MEKYNKVYIYYFSGTGNAMTAANWCNDYAISQGISSEIHTIEKADIDSIVPKHTIGKTLIGFCYPTHGFAPPWIMIKFLRKFPKLKNTDVFFVNSKAGSKIGKFYLPGMTGLAQWLSIFIFWFKGYSVRGSLSLDMPQSWVSFCPPNPKTYNIQIIERCHKIVNKMCLKMFNGKRYYRYTVWTQLWFDLAMAPIVPLYIFMGRFYLAKTLFSSYECNNCKICEANCPVNAIVIKDDRPYWKYTCESCMRCMNICPKKSIQSWVTRIAIIYYILFALGFSYLNYNGYLLFAVKSIIFFPIYWLFFWVLRYKIVNVIFTFTSLTRFWDRYLTPNIKLKDFKTTKNQ